MDLKDKQNQDTITLAMLAMHALSAGRKNALPFEEAKNRGLQ